MALFKNAELHYIRVIPNRPNRRFSRDNPTWEVQVRTYDAQQKKEWEANGLKLKGVVPEEEGARPYWKTVIKKRVIKKDGEPATPVEVKNGDLSDCDPAIIGNGSIADVRAFQYEYKDNMTGETKIANVLSGIKLKKLIKYTPKPRDDEFEPEEMEIVEEEDEDDDDAGEEEVEAEEKPKTPSVKPKSKFD